MLTQEKITECKPIRWGKYCKTTIFSVVTGQAQDRAGRGAFAPLPVLEKGPGRRGTYLYPCVLVSQCRPQISGSGRSKTLCANDDPRKVRMWTIYNDGCRRIFCTHLLYCCCCCHTNKQSLPHYQIGHKKLLCWVGITFFLMKETFEFCGDILD